MENNDIIAVRFGERVRALRSAKGMTQSELAQAIGKHQSAITKIEAGTQQTTLEDIYMIAEALGVKVTVLLPDSESRTALYQTRLRTLVEVIIEKQDELRMIRDDYCAMAAEYMGFIEDEDPKTIDILTIPGSDTHYLEGLPLVKIYGSPSSSELTSFWPIPPSDTPTGISGWPRIAPRQLSPAGVGIEDK